MRDAGGVSRRAQNQRTGTPSRHHAAAHDATTVKPRRQRRPLGQRTLERPTVAGGTAVLEARAAAGDVALVHLQAIRFVGTGRTAAFVELRRRAGQHTGQRRDGLVRQLFDQRLRPLHRVRVGRRTIGGGTHLAE